MFRGEYNGVCREEIKMQKRDARISLAIDEATLKKVLAQATKEDKTLSAMVRDLLKFALRNRKISKGK